jgi:hypothetical protein
MILYYESGSQEDQFDGKKEGQKSRDTIPLNSIRVLTLNSLLCNQHRLNESFRYVQKIYPLL